jgi:two-component system KDP operon response regulator KdpE
MPDRKILIADDDVGLVRLLRTSLETLGVKILQAHDAMYALTVIHNSPPDLVVMDVTMPAGNGLSACEMLASDARLRRLPVIILTGDSSDATLARCQKMRAHRVLKGSQAIEEVRALVCRLLSIQDADVGSPVRSHG